MEPVCALLSGVLCVASAGFVLEAVPGVVLVEDCEDCEPHFEEPELSGEVLDGVEDSLEELLVCGALPALESGVEVLPVAPVVLLVVLELPAMLPVDPVRALADVFGVLDCELMSLEELLGEAELLPAMLWSEL